MSKFQAQYNPYHCSSISHSRHSSTYSQFNPLLSNSNSHYLTHQISHLNPSFVNQQKIINPLSTFTSYSNQPSPFHKGCISNSTEQDYVVKKKENPFYRTNLIKYSQNPQQNSSKIGQDKYQQLRYHQNHQSFILAPITQQQRQYNRTNYHRNDMTKGLVELANQKYKDKLQNQRLNYHKSDLAKGLLDFGNQKYQQQKQIEERQNYYQTDLGKGLTNFANQIEKDRREQQQRQNYYKTDTAKGLLNFANQKYKTQREQEERQNYYKNDMAKGLTDFANQKYKNKREEEDRQNYYKSDMAKGLTDFANKRYKTQKEEEDRQNYYKSDMAKGLTNFANAKYKEQSQKSQLTKKSSIIQKIDQKQFGSFGKDKQNVSNLKKRIEQDKIRKGEPQISQVQNGYKYFMDSDEERQSGRFISYASEKVYPSKIKVRGVIFHKIEIN